jgi:hypothetical protein
VAAAAAKVTAAGEEAIAARVWVRGMRGRDRVERADLSFFHHPGIQRGGQCQCGRSKPGARQHK